MKIRFKIKDGKSVTVCPNGRIWNDEVVNVGDDQCAKCIFFEKVSNYSKILICSFQSDSDSENAIKTYEDGIDDCVEVIKGIGNFSYVDKLRVIWLISKLKENRNKS
jgi:asparagine synthetase B (glutamine-hydrolysing)